MIASDVFYILQWWGYLVVIGLIFFPLVGRIFSGFIDKGYLFAKVIGIVVLSYIVFALGVSHIAPFTQLTIFVVTLAIAAATTIFLIKYPERFEYAKPSLFLNIFEEAIFLGGLFFWANIRAHQPDIFGLEKYMDFGFVNSILRSTYFPPRDMWYTPLPINYYYFGHLVTAVITKLSGIQSYVSFNLMLATLSSMTYALSFSLAGNIWSYFIKDSKNKYKLLAFIPAGALGGFLVGFGGNLHTIYTFFTAYANDNPVPFWQLIFSPSTFPNGYWYPNATRFIYHTIHEFPIYSFVVSDLHGHVLDIPLVLTTIGILFVIMVKPITSKSNQSSNIKLQKNTWNYFLVMLWKWDIGYWILLGFFLACMYMTNAWDGMIYFLLSAAIIFWKNWEKKNNYFLTTIYQLITIFVAFLIFSLPFSLFFNPGELVGGIGLICSPQFLINIGKIGPFVFEPNHCIHSPLWQLLILYGFFIFWLLSFVIILIKQKHKLSDSDIFISILSAIAILLILIPEFFYLRDIYTTYFRANTMFKLVYQAFIIFSLSTGYMIFRFLQFISSSQSVWWRKILLLPYLFIGLIFFGLVAIYPYFAINSYYGDLKTYQGLNGINYLSKSYPSDAKAIAWIQTHISGQPVILEAQGDSYTEYARVSSNTGLPTVLGWPVHEWLWRGTYNIVPPRSNDIQTMYETKDISVFTSIAKKYDIKYVFVGELERKKYPLLNETKFLKMGKPVFHTGLTTIYKLSL